MPSTTGTLLLATSSLAAGTVLGYWLHSRYPKCLAPLTSLTTAHSTVSRWLSGSLDVPESDASSAGTTPRLIGGEPERVPLKVLLLVRVDAGMDRSQLCCNASRAVLQLFKKLYKRRHTNVLAWDRQGAVVVPLACDKQELVHTGELAVLHGVTTHSIKERGTQERVVMAVGPAEADVLLRLASGLALL